MKIICNDSAAFESHPHYSCPESTFFTTPSGRFLRSIDEDTLPVFTFDEKDGVPHEAPLRCPDCGPPGNRFCYECNEPVDDETFNSYLDYNDPMAAVLGKCDICGAPDYRDIGHCPVCNGPVLNFGENYACYHTISGNCDFSLSKNDLELQEINTNSMVGNLLIGPMRFNVIHGSGQPNTVMFQRIVHTKNEEWTVETLDYDPEQED